VEKDFSLLWASSETVFVFWEFLLLGLTEGRRGKKGVERFVRD
jgi:hypothetical protein